MRVGKFAEQGESDFLRYEDLSLEQNRTLILIHPHSQPLKNLSIQPKIAEMFRDSVFSEGCEISIDIEMNRVAIRSLVEAEEHLTKLRLEIDSLRRSYESFQLLQACRDQRQDAVTLLGYFRELWGRNQARAQTCQDHWQLLRDLLPEIAQAYKRSGASFPQLEDLMKAMNDFADLLKQAVDAQKVLPGQLNQFLDLLHTEEYRMQRARLSVLLDAEMLRKTLENIGQAELKLAQAREALAPYFDSDRVHFLTLEELSQVIQQEISGPQGTIDQLRHALHRIGHQ